MSWWYIMKSWLNVEYFNQKSLTTPFIQISIQFQLSDQMKPFLIPEKVCRTIGNWKSEWKEMYSCGKYLLREFHGREDLSDYKSLRCSLNSHFLPSTKSFWLETEYIKFIYWILCLELFYNPSFLSKWARTQTNTPDVCSTIFITSFYFSLCIRNVDLELADQCQYWLEGGALVSWENC